MAASTSMLTSGYGEGAQTGSRRRVDKGRAVPGSATGDVRALARVAVVMGDVAAAVDYTANGLDAEVGARPCCRSGSWMRCPRLARAPRGPGRLAQRGGRARRRRDRLMAVEGVGAWPLGRVFREPVADAANGEDELRILRISLDLLAKFGDARMTGALSCSTASAIHPRRGARADGRARSALPRPSKRHAWS